MEDKEIECDGIRKKREKLCNEFISNVTLHGFRLIFQEKGFRRIYWLLIMLGSFVLAGLLFGESLIEFIQFKTLTVNGKDYSSKEVDFPTLTLCNFGSLSSKRLKHFPFRITEEDFISSYRYYIGRNANWSYRLFSSKLQAAGAVNLKDVLSLYELNLKDMLDDEVAKQFPLNCEFQKKSCDSRDFKTTISWTFPSLCHQFNYYQVNKPTLKSTKTGRHSGITLLLNLHLQKALNNGPAEGLVVYIHPYGVPHFLDSYSTLIMMETGKLNSIILKEHHVNY